ncbi:hypothetical protein [Desulfatirhabdium butyrativorans]|uniref:hypothetical protein n=1 Tax=Desulfatirhabdium butyrativorans TaxID=340467 RepID=UPI0012EBF561|nr:hypothetical protein [Desulfatirhabdium butyrativorans]
MKLFASREEDAHQGWVWLQNANIPERCIVKITNPANKKRIYCEALQIENNFLSGYNQPPRHFITDPASSLVINGWFRNRLGNLQSQNNIPLIIKPCHSWWAQFKACTNHPQIIVRLAARLGGISLFLGVLGILLGLISIWK